MRFELSEALVDQIIFAMEDQNRSCLLDSRRALVVDAAEAYGEDLGDDLEDSEADRWLPLPEWGPADGFRVMKGFSASLHNPPVAAELVAALDRGRGVFRAFKDALATHPEVEKLWFSYKAKELRRLVLAWYNALREEWGLEALGEEPEETGDLVLEDFRIREAGAGDLRQIRALHESLLASGVVDLPAVPDPLETSGSLSWIAETSRGDLVAFALAGIDSGAARVFALEVQEAFRGLGLAEELLSRLIDAVSAADISSLSIDLPVASEGFSHVLSRRGFRPILTRFRRDARQLE